MTKQSKNTLITAIAILAGLALLLYGLPAILSHKPTPEEIADLKARLAQTKATTDSLRRLQRARAQRDSAEAAQQKHWEEIKNDVAQIAAITSPMRVTEDKLESRTWYEPKSRPKSLSADWIGCYFGIMKDRERPRLRMVLQSVFSSTLFIKGYKIKADTNLITIMDDDVKRDYSSGNTLEHSDVVVGAEEYRALRAVANAKEATIRAVGADYYHDRKVTPKEQAAIAEVLSVYEKLLGMSSQEGHQ